MSYYEKKYLKYKNKYLTLKKQIGGNPCTSTTGIVFKEDDYTLKYSGCDTIKNKCKFNYNSIVINTKEDETKNNKITAYNDKLGQEILACKPTLKQLLDAGYTISEIDNKINLPFTFPDIVEYNTTATKKIVFNDMNMLNFGQLKTSYSDEDKYKFTTCYDKFDYLNLTKASVESINKIISNFWDSTLQGKEAIEKHKYLEMIKYFARIILSKDKVGQNVINIENLGTSKNLRDYLSTFDDIKKLRWK
jgi:hypothetical protein